MLNFKSEAGYPMVKVLWEDAVTASEAGWTEKDEAMEVATSRLPLMRTVGWCIHHCSRHIALTDSMGDNEFGQVTKIPMGNVVVLWELEEDPKEPLYTNKEIL